MFMQANLSSYLVQKHREESLVKVHIFYTKYLNSQKIRQQVVKLCMIPGLFCIRCSCSLDFEFKYAIDVYLWILTVFLSVISATLGCLVSPTYIVDILGELEPNIVLRIQCHVFFFFSFFIMPHTVNIAIYTFNPQQGLRAICHNQCITYWTPS